MSKTTKSANGDTVTAAMRAALVSIRRNRIVCSWETRVLLCRAGLVAPTLGDDYNLTTEGNRVADAERARLESVRSTRNAAARGRTAAMLSVGMTRTPYGWE